jgi:phage N-6-adenine-methyltransferase
LFKYWGFIPQKYKGNKMLNLDYKNHAKIQAVTGTLSRRNLNSTFPSHPGSVPLAKGIDPRKSALFTSNKEDWNTPFKILKAVDLLLGEIDLDPCWNHESMVSAKQVFTKEDNGLIHEWNGRVYINPPYGRVVPVWMDKLLHEYRSGRTKEAIVLLPARTDTKWFQMMAGFPVCFIKGRLKFSNSANSAPFPSAVFYLGNREDQFKVVFNEIGQVYNPFVNR